MIEKIVKKYLSENLTVPVKLEKPEKQNPPYVVIDKTGTRRKDFIETTTLALQSYGETKQKAAELNEIVKAAMDNLISLPIISASDLDTDYDFTNTQTKEYRYQAIYNVTTL